jgi:hypothetical protein
MVRLQGGNHEYSERFLISEPCYHSPTVLKRCKAENKRLFALYNAVSKENLAFPNVNIFKIGKKVFKVGSQLPTNHIYF